MKNRIIVGICLLTLSTGLRAQTNAPAAKDAAIFSLEQFGPVNSVDTAEATFQKASDAIIAAGGGIIVIPAQVPDSWVPKNTSQHELRTPTAPAQTKSWKTGPGLTVVDVRGSTTKVMPPQADGMVIQRTLNLAPGESLPHWGYFPLLSLKNTILHGSTSYHDWLQEPVTAGKDQRFYVATIRGIFPGEFVNGLQYSGGVPRLCVKSLGYDQAKKSWYFVADTDVDVQKGALISNKNHVNVLSMETFSHTENQTFDVRMWRHNYSQGDNYLFDARFKYMSDVHSTAGDENGVLYAAFVESETAIFRGKIEKWSPETGELKYQSGPTGGTLGSGRPIINLNPAKWITGGSVMIVRPGGWDSTPDMECPVFEGKTYPTTIEKNKLGIPSLKMGGLIRFSAEAPITDAVVGRYFAVDEKNEYVPNTDVRRWYLIDSVTKNANGTTDMKIIRHWWGAKAMCSPTLYKPESFSADGHLQPLKYIIAPGANAYDVADGVNNPKRTIKLVPTPFTSNPAVDFAAGDAVEQAIGPDPFKPTPFRSWLWDQVPGAFPAAVFDIANNGAVMRDSLLWVHGNSSGDIEKDKASHYDRNPPWNKLMRLDATCNTGISFGADTANAAILFTQPHHVQPLKWFYYGTESNQPTKVASLTVSRETGEFAFVGGGARFDGPVTTTGLSADKTPARNLRGKNVAVPDKANSMTVAFPITEADGDYAVFVEQNWIGNRAIIKKDAKGFTIQFEKSAPANAQLDWMIIR